MSTWEDWTDHWKSQLRRHETEYKLGGIALATVLAGPAIGGAWLAVEKANQLQGQTDAIRTAKQEMAQSPLQAGESIRDSLSVPNIGVTGEIEVGTGLQKYVIPLMIFLIVLYVIFKD